MKKWIALLLAALLVLCCACTAQQPSLNDADATEAPAADATQAPADATDAPEEGGEAAYRVGIIQLTEHAALDAAREGFVAALEASGLDIEIETQNAQGEQTVCATIATKFVNDEVDLILAIATPAAQAAAQATRDIPILVTAVTDPAASGLVAFSSS